jgi:hypothetical protein
MLILLSQNEEGISALDLQKHIFPSGSSPMKNTFPWEPTTICTCKTDNFLINIRNQQLYVLAKQTINALLKLMVKMNTRNLSVLQVHIVVGSECLVRKCLFYKYVE